MSATTLPELCESLDQAFTASAKGKGVIELIKNYVQNGAGDWKEYALFTDDFYARNLIQKNDLYEIMVICWKEGQVSPIHNHEGSGCWLGVLEGDIKETYYHTCNNCCKVGEMCCSNLREGSSSTLKNGRVGFISDGIALHVIEPTNSKCGVSLHLYSPPIKECNVYDHQHKKVVRKTLGFYSINKIPINQAG
eukprot:TRINITY_DN7863_c0_g1_i1.p1 TRINITY_DN7863_c0_g1~~TRINITY_DN7863_c0_g1_i1.p1  ORF type:complete len:206 (+),score=42.65 TRINITY_DN7863_c0_g1_i1:42-620(+)